MPPEAGARLIFTRWGTLVYRDANGVLRHGDCTEVPRNVFISQNAYLTSPDVADQPIELIGTASRLNFIRQNGVFCAAEPDGTFGCGRARMSGWERFLLLSETELNIYLQIQANDWSLRDASLINTGDIKFLVDFRLKFGNFIINLAVPGAIIVTEHGGLQIGEIRAVHDGWNIISARRFKPLVYFAVFGKEHIFQMLKLCLESIGRYGLYAGHICILSDRAPERLGRYIPPALAGRTICLFRDVTDHAGMMMERFDMADLPIEAFQPVLCLDADMICDAPITPMLAVCNGEAKFFGSCEYGGVPIAAIHPPTRDWFGRFLFDAAGCGTDDIYCLNGGAIGFPHRDFAAPVFAQIKTAFTEVQRVFPAYQRMGEQPILNYVLQGQNLIDANALNKFIRFRYQHFNQAEAGTGLVHFNYGPGADKLEHMREYVAMLSGGK